MGTLIESYEQQYSILTAEITARIGNLKMGNYENRERLDKEIQSGFEEAHDLLEQLELEVRGSGATNVSSRVSCYKAELERIKKEYKSIKSKGNENTYIDVEDNGYDDWNSGAEQKRKLLDNAERLERTGKTLNEGYKVILETEQMGAAVLEDLSVQRETIQRARSRLQETDENLNRSARIMNSMIMRSLRERFVLVIFFLLFGVIGCTAVYFYLT